MPTYSSHNEYLIFLESHNEYLMSTESHNEYLMSPESHNEYLILCLFFVSLKKYIWSVPLLISC
jgi:hypothetical protein